MIIDSHAHLHPSDANTEAWDFDSVDETLAYQQRTLYKYRKPEALTSSGQSDPDAWQLLWDDQDSDSWSGRRDVNFRIQGDHFLWDNNGETYSTPIRQGTSTALLLDLMDFVGVSKAVIHASLRYNRFYSDIVTSHPDRFLPLAFLVDDGGVEQTISQLTAAVESGHVGVYQNPVPGSAESEQYHTARFDPIWREVDRRGLPVYTTGFMSAERYADMFPNLKSWAERFPTIKRVLVHGFPVHLLQENERVRIPDEFERLVRDFPMLVEILPFAHRNYEPGHIDDVVRALYDTLGPERLVWGSEFIKSAKPHTRDHYAEIKGFLDARCSYMTSTDIELILGKNLETFFGLA